MRSHNTFCYGKIRKIIPVTLHIWSTGVRQEFAITHFHTVTYTASPQTVSTHCRRKPKYQNKPYLLQHRKVWGYTSMLFFTIFTKGNNFCYFLFASLDEERYYEMQSALKGKNLLPGSKFFPLRADPN